MKKKYLLLSGVLNLLFVKLAFGAPGSTFNTVFGGTVNSYDEWINKAWNWSMIAMIPLSTLMLTVAGFLWMTSGGNPDRISSAKKIIIGVFSGIALILLSKLFIVVFLGAGGSSWNIN